MKKSIYIIYERNVLSQKQTEDDSQPIGMNHSLQPISLNIVFYRIKQICEIIKKKLFVFFFYELAWGFSGYWVEFLSVLLNFVTATQTPDYLFVVLLVFTVFFFFSFSDYFNIYSYRTYRIRPFAGIPNVKQVPNIESCSLNRSPFPFIHPFIWFLFILFRPMNRVYVLWIGFSFLDFGV